MVYRVNENLGKTWKVHTSLKYFNMKYFRGFITVNPGEYENEKIKNRKNGWN